MLWSSSWILIRWGLDDENVAPLTFAGLRYGLAAVTLVFWVSSQSDRRAELLSIDSEMRRRLVVLGVVFFAVTQGAQFVAIDAQPAATTSLTLAPTAFFVALLSGRMLAERSSSRQFVGAGLIAIGASLYLAGDLGATTVGMIAALTGLAANVAGSVLGRSANRGASLSPAVVTAVSMSVGATALLVFGLAIEGWPALSVRLVVIIGWLAIINTALAFTLWNKSLQHLTAIESAAINNTMLIQIAALAWIFLDESPGALGSIGILVVSLGAFLATANSS